MSYEKPDKIPEEQANNVIIWHNTMDVIRVLADELRKFNLKFDVYEYYKNEYCPDSNKRKCHCPHWMLIHLMSITPKLYQPHCYIWICKRKRVYELRYEDIVAKDFWIKVDNRTQEVGKYIHSYGLTQVAEDINIIYQAAEIKDYTSEHFNEYYRKMFMK